MGLPTGTLPSPCAVARAVLASPSCRGRNTMLLTPDLASVNQPFPDITEADHASLHCWVQGAPLTVFALSEHLQQPASRALALVESGNTRLQPIGDVVQETYSGDVGRILARLMQTQRQIGRAHV